MKRTMRFLSGVVLSVSFAALSGCGYGGVDSSPPATNLAPTDFASTGFVTARDLQLKPVGEGAATSIDLPAGTEVAVLERRVDADLGALVRVGVDRSDAEGGTLDLWLRSDELFETDLLPYAPSDEASSGDGDEVDALMTYCFRYVKQYLLKIGKVNVYLPGGSAYQAATILPKYGFRRTGNSPATAVENEVCVYGGGPAGHGHIEVKRGGKWWYGYGFKANPIANRRFLGCFYK